MNARSPELTTDKSPLETLITQHQFIIGFYEFHPQEFEDLSEEELELLQQVYFMDRDIDVDDVAAHIDEQTRNNPEVITALNTAVSKVADNLGFTDEMKANLLLLDEDSQ